MFPKNARSGASLAAALALFCCAALCARASEKTDVGLALLVEQDYDSNVLLLHDDPIGSAVTYVRPSIGIENTGTLGYAHLNGWLSSHTFWNETKLNGVDRGMSGDFDRTVLPRLALFGNGSYQRVAPHAEIRGPNVISISGGAPGTPGTPVVSPGQLLAGEAPNVDLAQGEFGARYTLTPRNRLSLSGGPFSVDYLGNQAGTNEFRNQDGWFGRMTVDDAATALDRLNVTLGANSTNQANVTIGAVDTGKSISDQQSLSLGWNRTWNELWTTSGSIGVRRLHTQTLGASRPVTHVVPAPGVPGGVQPVVEFIPTDFEDTGPGLIGSMVVERALPRGTASLSYSRETRTSGSLTVSDVNVDTLEASYVHRLSARATFTLTGSYQHYTSANDIHQIKPAFYVPGSFNPITGADFVCTQGSLEFVGSGPGRGAQCDLPSHSRLTSNYYTGIARIDWQLRKRLSTFANVRFDDRVGDVGLFGPDYNRFTVGVGFTYDYGLGY